MRPHCFLATCLLVLIPLPSLGQAPAPVAAWQAELASPEAHRRADAAAALGYLGAPARVALPALRAALQDRDGMVRAAAAFAVGRLAVDGTEDVPALRKLLRAGEPLERRA